MARSQTSMSTHILVRTVILIGLALLLMLFVLRAEGVFLR